MESHSLCRILSKLGIMSRKQAGEAILQGRISVNNEVVRDPGKVVSFSDKILVDGNEATKRDNVYILLNKPPRCVTTRTDPQGRRTVYDLMKGNEWVVPAGRLDYDTSGLLIMTNDTKFADEITSPSSKIWKTYAAKIKGTISEEERRRLEEGIMLDNERTLPAKVSILSTTGKSTRIEVSIQEGKNRQVRRMLESLGKKVLALSRTAIGNIKDESLKPGSYRLLTEKEVGSLRSS